MTDMARKLSRWRARLEMTQADAANLLGVPLRTYQGWELGRRIERERILIFALAHLEENSKKHKKGS